MFAGAERGVVHAEPGCAMVLSGVDVADLNYIIIRSASEQAAARFKANVDYCDQQQLPFCALVADSVAAGLQPLCESLGLLHAAQWPLMVCSGQQPPPQLKANVLIRPVSDAAGLAGMARVLADAYGMPAAAVHSAMPLENYQSPAISTYIAEQDGEVVSSVTLTRHGEVAGIWAMGTLNSAQGRGAGKALLAGVMEQARQAGATSFFLGATPAGFPLYERLGYRTVCQAQIWVRGETGQA
jgi:GNAT superfamily N-acetyltransferase